VWERYGGDWAWDDLVWDYGAPVSALTVNDNVQYLNVTPAATGVAEAGDAGVSAHSWVVAWNPDVPYYQVENGLMLAAPGTPAHSGIDRAPGSKDIRLFGSITANGMHEGLAIIDPAEFAAVALRQMLLARGVTVTGAARAWHRLSECIDHRAVRHRAQGACDACVAAAGRRCEGHAQGQPEPACGVVSAVAGTPGRR
jgi:D-alanyl-D-alanine carboxypeptidase/D-alanyl-D-alanine-endopeptidase (penicillin-binding protein 4)